MVDTALTRQMVSFQANKKRPAYRWFKYKEAFSANLVEYLLAKYKIESGRVLDPFAGVGTTLFAASELGFSADGIELLPVGRELIRGRKTALFEIDAADIRRLKAWRDQKPWLESHTSAKLNHLNITRGAYPPETEYRIGQFFSAIEEEIRPVRQILLTALMCVLESVSYTRKDGQYLRWDYRAEERNLRSKFDKGEIIPFERAITEKLNEIIADIEQPYQADLFGEPMKWNPEIGLYGGSCINILPEIESDKYDTIVTSPPYCNRYDYTRTYALELALLGISESEMSHLRQTMMSCTVENREKNLVATHSGYGDALNVADQQPLLQKILAYLNEKNQRKELNNTGIPRMVKGYFYELTCIVSECLRVLKPGGRMFMVNDNVRYAGASISVDLILSDIAGKLGFSVEDILVLPQRKRNSSQQMGGFGRDALRKSICVWKKDKTRLESDE